MAVSSASRPISLICTTCTSPTGTHRFRSRWPPWTNWSGKGKCATRRRRTTLPGRFARCYGFRKTMAIRHPPSPSRCTTFWPEASNRNTWLSARNTVSRLFLTIHWPAAFSRENIPHKKAPSAGTRFHDNKMYLDRYWHPALFAAVEKLSAIAQREGMSLVALAFRWLLAQPGVDSIILGATRLEQIDQNVKACRGPCRATGSERMRCHLDRAPRCDAKIQPLTQN